jgi:hypothetical protein
VTEKKSTSARKRRPPTEIRVTPESEKWLKERAASPDGLRAIVDGEIEEVIENEGIEKEANDVAAEILIPRSSWKRSLAYLKPSAAAIRDLATQLQINPAIIAGRVRRERKKYSCFSKLVGYRTVRALFPEVKWGK